LLSSRGGFEGDSTARGSRAVPSSRPATTRHTRTRRPPNLELGSRFRERFPVILTGVVVATDDMIELLADLFRQPWQADALCQEPHYVELNWFPERGESTNAAKAVCSRCLVRDECLGFAIERGVAEGIWGGTSGRERRALRSRAA
jgi:WhiB family transcriptional regulator, redox-sensing transcriptional regulator